MGAAALTLLLESRMNPRFPRNLWVRVPPDVPPRCDGFERLPAQPDVLPEDDMRGSNVRSHIAKFCAKVETKGAIVPMNKAA